ncbi:MAG: glycosyltransferase [Magnetococcales bacterium]|nr:glycosyltransferase [Magnetococcales bacterium]
MSGDSAFCPMGLSVVMIGRDEAELLPLTLPPLIRLADEVIFVDTGSRDDTPRIALELGAQLASCAWEDDFSAARNSALQRARFAWVFSVDCDEELTEPPRQSLRTLLEQLCFPAGEPGFLVTIKNRLDSGVTLPQKSLRLFRNDPRLRFVNPVHETVRPGLARHWPGFVPTPIPLTLLHHGYERGRNREKFLRNVRILRQWVSREPENLFACYKLGMNLHHIGSATEGLLFMERAFKLLDAAPNRREYAFLDALVTVLHRALMEAGREDEAASVMARIKRWE